MAKFRKKPVVVEAVQWTGGSTGVGGFGVIKHFCPTAEQWACRRLLPNGVNVHDDINGEPMLRIPTLEGAHWALTNDWIVKGIEDEFYPVKPSVFGATYEPIPSPSQGLCETTATERFQVDGCICGTYPDNLGPCAKFSVGGNGRCVFCDHTEACHSLVIKAVAI